MLQPQFFNDNEADMSRKPSIIIFFFLVLLNVGCDQISKQKVREEILPGEIIQVLDDYVILTNTENAGAFFGLGSELNPLKKLIFLQVIPIISLVLMLIYVFYSMKDATASFLAGMGFVIGGGIGNIFDRVRLGSVTDFLYIDIGWARTGIFNMADVSVLIGAFFLAIFFFKNQIKQHTTRSDPE